MSHYRRHRRAVWIVMGLWLPWWLMLSELSQGLSAGPAVEILRHSTPFHVTMHEGMLSLQAQDASLKEIIQALGQQLGLETMVQIPDEARVTMAFDHLPIAEALQALRQHAIIAYVVQDGGDVPGTITKLFASPKGGWTAPATDAAQATDSRANERPVGPERRVRELSPSEDAPHPRAFRFDLDPSQVIPPGR